MRTLSHVDLRPAGPYASLVDLGAEPSPETSRRVERLRRALSERPLPEVRDLVPGFASLLVEHRPSLTPERLRAWLDAAAALPDAAAAPRVRTVPVAYGADADADDLATRLGRPFEDLTERHRAATYTVAFLGFTPGFPYLLGLPSELHLPRRERPRTRVPAGSVAIAERLAGIYPAASPGGWWILGRTPQRLFDPESAEPTWLAAGDVVRFEPAAGPLPSTEAPPSPPEPAEPAVELLQAVPGSVSLQGGPRYGVGHLGAAQAGSIDPVALEVGNRLLGNGPRSAAIESVGQPLAVRSLRPLVAAWTGGGMRARLGGREQRGWEAFAWPAGAVLELVPDRRAGGRTALLSLAGGIDGALWHGSRSSDVRAGAGGSRRWLRAGDVLGVAGTPTGVPLPHPGRPLTPRRVRVRLHPGPQFDTRAFEILAGRRFAVIDVDRTGVRLDGPAVPHPEPSILSDGAPLGAVQVTPDGQPIVLLADRGRTGGYAKPAVVDARDLWRFAQARPGDEVAFVDARVGPERLGAPEPLDSWS